MTEPANSGGLIDPETALQREVETLSQRFPDVDPAELDERVHVTYDRLSDEASVDSHLVAMTEKQVTEELREGGADVHVRGEENSCQVLQRRVKRDRRRRVDGSRKRSQVA